MSYSYGKENDVIFTNSAVALPDRTRFYFKKPFLVGNLKQTCDSNANYIAASPRQAHHHHLASVPNLRAAHKYVVGRVDIECLTLDHVLRSVHTVVVHELCVLSQQGTGNDHRLGCVIAEQDRRVV